ncbi:hypothetical protein FB567DRAFT_617195 [Paraphoma chrysanthemicola]|uniref:Uncharacterized protein n=1 Tax=Paraphoma chrysanthemicola TaxID=798071 RepID=A0A8K0RDD0_9PLEO|nr:hypothetical protein FB567DRAFT_617195 [Paraphoma chrysanthemicola]
MLFLSILHLGAAYAAPPFFPHSAALLTSSPLAYQVARSEGDIPGATSTTNSPLQSPSMVRPCSWVSGRPMQTCFPWPTPSSHSSMPINGTIPTPPFYLVPNTFAMTYTAANGTVFTIRPDPTAGNFITVSAGHTGPRVGALTLPAATPTSNHVQATDTVTVTADDGVVFTLTRDANGEYVNTESKERLFHTMKEKPPSLNVGTPTPSPGAAKVEGKWTVYQQGLASTFIKRVKKQRSESNQA